MAIRPDIDVIKGTVTTSANAIPGMASSIAIIGAFDSEVTDITVCSTAESAHSIFGTTGTVGNFKGTDAIDGLFYGASSLIVANITTWSDDETPVASTTITNEKLTAALAKLKHESFSMLFVADELSDAAQTIVSTWLSSEFNDKFAHGQVAQLQKSTASAYVTSVATFNDQLYWLTTQAQGTLSLNETAAIMAGYIASLPVNKSLTNKVIPVANSISPEYTTESGDIGAKLLELSVPFLEVRNRINTDVICVNSELPNKLDLYINRTRDYVINSLEAEVLLGEINSESTSETAHTIAERVRKECVDDLKLLKDIEYHIEKVSSKVSRIALDRLLFDDVIVKVEIPFNIEVQ